MAAVQIELSDSFAKEAEQAGLLTAEVMERLLREAMRQRAAERLRLAMDRMAEADIPPMTEEEIQAEIDAVRAERRALQLLDAFIERGQLKRKAESRTGNG